MKLILSLVFASLLSAPIAFADCSIMRCWDGCTSNWKNVYGDTCDSQWDSNRGCWSAIGVCGGQSGGNICGGQTTSCWNSCTSNWKTVHGNRCDNAWNSAQGCWEAIGTCN